MDLINYKQSKKNTKRYIAHGNTKYSNTSQESTSCSLHPPPPQEEMQKNREINAEIW